MKFPSPSSAESVVAINGLTRRFGPKTVLDAVAHYDTAVFVGGATVIDTKHRVTLHRTMMQPTLAREVSAFFETRGHAAMAAQTPRQSRRTGIIAS